MHKLEEKIKKILKKKFPNYSDKEVEKVITDYGQIIILETIQETVMKIPNEEERFVFGKLIDEGKIEESEVLAQKHGIDMNQIFLEKSQDAVKEVFSL